MYFNYYKRIFKRISQNIHSPLCALEQPCQMEFRPSHSINPPGETATVSSAAAEAAVGPARAIGPVMPSITLMNSTVQQCINKTCDSTC